MPCPKPACHVSNLVHPLPRILRLNRPTSPGLCARAPADRSLQLLRRHTSHIGQGRKLFNHRYWRDGYWLHGTRRPPATKRSGEGEGLPRSPPDQTLLVNLRSRLREKRSAHGAFHILGCGTLVSVRCPQAVPRAALPLNVPIVGPQGTVHPCSDEYVESYNFGNPDDSGSNGAEI
jgi:hypothetical protein